MKHSRQMWIGALLAGLSLLPVAASAAPITFAFTLAPEATGATGSGFATAVFDTAIHSLEINANWSGLTGTTTVAHIHCCTDAPATVGVAVTPGTFPGFPVGVTGGTYSTTLNTALTSTFTAAFLTNFGGGTAAGAEQALLNGMLAGRAYLNIHSLRFPGGEIRGFATVPEPATLALLGLGLAALGLARRKRAA